MKEWTSAAWMRSTILSQRTAILGIWTQDTTAVALYARLLTVNYRIRSITSQSNLSVIRLTGRRVHGQDLRWASVYKYNRLRCGGADREPHIVMNVRSWGRNIIKLGGRQCSCERNTEQVEPQVGNRLATSRQYLSDLLPVWAQLRLALRLSTFIYNSSEKLRVYHLSLTVLDFL